MKKFNAFTLAEVLITLGIIGVVAAMTMPTLMNSTNGAQYKTAYKKALSVLSQAVVLNVALDDYDLSQATETSTKATDGSSASLYNLFNNRMNVVKTDTGSGTATWTTNVSDVKLGPGSGNYTLYFNDGITFTFPKTGAKAANCTEGNATDTTGNKCYGVIDVNGEKNPNKVVNCDGKAWNAGGDDCTVSNPTDIYPVVMYDQTILPATRAGEAVLYGAGK
ncbi:putative uncharacterized protein [Brachyspira sp. CAG:484]|nr:putative uncharacterized protein [Brachyspira sp. CAG:484]